MGTLLERMGVSLGAACEILELEKRLIQAMHPSALTCGDFDLGLWKAWPKRLAKRNKRIAVLLAGIPCVTLSDAGKKLEHADPDSRRFMDTAKAAVALCVKLLLIENLWSLVN